MAFERDGIAAPALELPADPGRAGAPAPRLNVAVVFTSIEATLAALREAGLLAARLSGRITLLALQAVPYPLPLASPPVPLDWNLRRFHAIASESPVETSVRLYLCRDRTETLLAALKPHTLIVVGGVRRWWPTAERRLARRLRRAGHEVIFKEVG